MLKIIGTFTKWVQIEYRCIKKGVDVYSFIIFSKYVYKYIFCAQEFYSQAGENALKPT